MRQSSPDIWYSDRNLHETPPKNPLRFAHLLDILCNCSRLVIFECASGEDLTPDVTECASDAKKPCKVSSKIKICLRDLIRFCVQSSPLPASIDFLTCSTSPRSKKPNSLYAPLSSISTETRCSSHTRLNDGLKRQMTSPSSSATPTPRIREETRMRRGRGLPSFTLTVTRTVGHDTSYTASGRTARRLENRIR
ncbi:hypothetical protein SISSUDRAFT_1050749 [Sistotremastrum suecicum HHB10207 ss-3]|uniref:Uncharacterized protein n=1 Tax=Sistotremastrum suecicum HHB10207 ss-3 TaxID=1314776 RepID=A0A166B0E0_9AGAM|nr:hypothetical protein SISSUDRAFT_1050749 [Sistotremastrum suecicum HHB10207 ss-3]